MVQTEDIESADRLSRRRARMLPALAMIFIVQQASYFSAQIEDAPRTVDHVKIAAWLVLSVVLLLALMTGGFWFRPKRVRDLLNDEVTRANRLDGLRVGFVATMAAGIATYFLAMFEPITGRDAIHLLMTVGIAAALLRFGQLERRAHRDG
jgi:hypothetical protein